MGKKWMAAAYGMTCACSAAGCAPAVWRASLHSLVCGNGASLIMNLQIPAFPDMRYMSCKRHPFEAT